MKITTIVLVLFMPLFSISQEKYSISGNIVSLPEHSYLYLSYVSNGEAHLDSAQVQKDHTFKFNGEIPIPSLAKLIIRKEEGMDILKETDQVLIYLTNGKMTISGENLLTATVDAENPIAKDYEKYRAMEKPIEDSLIVLNHSLKTSLSSQKEPMKFIEVMKDKLLNIEWDRKKLKFMFIKEYPESHVSFDFLNELVNYDNLNELAIPAYHAFPEAIKESERGKELASKMELLKPFSNGSFAPEFSLPDTLGKQVALSSFRGKYVFIDFWASWCLPCRFENPNVIAAYTKFKDKNFTVLGISLDEAKDKENWLRAIQEDHVQQWQHVSDLTGWKSPVALLYKIQAIPRNFIIDPEGRIVGSDLRGPALNERLEKILN